MKGTVSTFFSNQMPMEHEENQKSISPPVASIISRLDRLDRVVHYMEEKHSMSQREFSTGKDLDYNRIKPLSTALDEIRVKGTLVERITMLESSVYRSLEEENNMISTKPRSNRKRRSPALMMSSLRYRGKWLGCFHTQTH